MKQSLSKLLRDLLKQAKKRGMSQCQISREAGVEEASIVRFMQGSRGLNLATAEKLLDFFGVKFIVEKRP